MFKKKVYAELLEIYGTETPQSASITYENIQDLNYLDCVIKETLRIFPAVPLFSRQLTKDLRMGMYNMKILGIITIYFFQL